MNDETLILYYYDDGLTADERREVESELASDPALARRYRELSRQLDGFGDVEAQAAPSHLVARWHDLIDRAAEREAVSASKPRRTFAIGSLFWGAAVTASLAVGIAIGVYLSGDAIDDPVPGGSFVDVTESPAGDAPTAFSRGLLVHFQESRDRLSGLRADGNGERARLITEIIRQNRLFARMATDNESQDLARVLRAFEPILVRLAADDISPQEAARLQSQLAFELNIMLTKLTRHVSEETDAIDI